MGAGTRSGARQWSRMAVMGMCASGSGGGVAQLRGEALEVKAPPQQAHAHERPLADAAEELVALVMTPRVAAGRGGPHPGRCRVCRRVSSARGRRRCAKAAPSSVDWELIAV